MEVEEDDLQQFWCCPANVDIDDEAVSKTQNLIPSALAQAEHLPCLWFRGILPASLTSIDPQFAPIKELDVMYTSPDKAVLCLAQARFMVMLPGGYIHDTLPSGGVGWALQL